MDELQILRDRANDAKGRFMAASGRHRLAADAVRALRQANDVGALQRAEAELRAARQAEVEAVEEYAHAARAAFAGLYESHA